jgi:transposase
MRLYASDFRLRGEGSQRDLARLFGVSLSFLQALLQRYCHTGSVAPKPHGGGNPGKIGPYLKVVQQLHQQQPDASLAERCAQVAATTPVYIGQSTIQQVLKQLRRTREKRRSTLRNRTLRKDAKPVRPSRS